MPWTTEPILLHERLTEHRWHSLKMKYMKEKMKNSKVYRLAVINSIVDIVVCLHVSMEVTRL